MNHTRLPDYPEHREPTERVEGVEFEREAQPRTHPWTQLWLALASMVVLFGVMLGYFYWEKYLRASDRPVRLATAPANASEEAPPPNPVPGTSAPDNVVPEAPLQPKDGQ